MARALCCAIGILFAWTAPPALAQIAPEVVYAWTNFVGQPGGSGNADGTGSTARFNRPSGVATDISGNVYVADTYNHTIRKVTPSGVVITLAGLAGQSGSTDGTGSAARFYYPQSTATDTSGNVYVADTRNNTIRKTSSVGLVTTLAGSAEGSGSADGTGGAALFFRPSGVTVDNAANLYVADSSNCTIRTVTPAGVVATLAGTAYHGGIDDGTGSEARFMTPQGVAADGAGNVYRGGHWKLHNPQDNTRGDSHEIGWLSNLRKH